MSEETKSKLAEAAETVRGMTPDEASRIADGINAFIAGFNAGKSATAKEADKDGT